MHKLWVLQQGLRFWGVEVTHLDDAHRVFEGRWCDGGGVGGRGGGCGGGWRGGCVAVLECPVEYERGCKERRRCDEDCPNSGKIKEQDACPGSK